jgi:hypothetical protein
MLNETKELVQNAKSNEYLDFKEKAIEILKQKTAEKLPEKGYFARMDQAKGIFEGCDKKVKEEDEKDEKKEEDEEE